MKWTTYNDWTPEAARSAAYAAARSTYLALYVSARPAESQVRNGMTGPDLVRRLRDHLEHGLLAPHWPASEQLRVAKPISNIGFRGVNARAVSWDMHDSGLSARSACSGGDSGPSHILKVIGLTDDEAYSCVRFSLGRFTTPEETDYAIEKVIISVGNFRQSRSGAIS